MAVMAETLLKDYGLDEMEKTGDVPIQFQVGRRKWPLGRYLREKLRDEVGIPEEWKEKIKQNWATEKSLEVSTLLNVSISAKETKSGSQLVADQNKGRRASVEARYKIHASKGTL